jgi:hypothetical protein
MAQEKSPVEWLRAKTAESYVPNPETIVAAGSESKTPAPKKDQVKGSKDNKPDSAKSTKSGSSIKFSDRVETGIKNKVEEHNKNAKDGRRATLSMLKAVYRRGAGAFSTSHRPGMSRDQWAMARVNAFLKLLRSGKPANSAYTTDNDLLPSGHPRSSKKSNSALTASGLVPEERDLANAILAVVEKHGKFNEDRVGVWAGYTPASENKDAAIGVICRNCVFYTEDEQGNDLCQIISLQIEDLGKCRLAIIPDGIVTSARKENLEEASMIAVDYASEMELAVIAPKENIFSSSNEAILALTEASGLGYEAEFAVKASWIRGVDAGQNPYKRARELALNTYESPDADLLPVREEESAVL